MNSVGTFRQGSVASPAHIHKAFSIAFLEGRMDDILSRMGTEYPYSENDVHLQVYLGPFESPIYGVIRVAGKRVLELHILDHPAAIDTTFRDLWEIHGSLFDNIPHYTM